MNESMQKSQKNVVLVDHALSFKISNLEIFSPWIFFSNFGTSNFVWP